jgi:hypothetical protein
VINYLGEINENGFIDLTMLNRKNELFVLFDGEIEPHVNNEIDVVIDTTKLEFKKNKSSTNIDLRINYALSYNLSGTLNSGDEYSETDIEMKLNYLSVNDDGKTSKKNLITVKNKVSGTNATEKACRKYFGKYNPSRVIVSDNDIQIHTDNIKPTNFTFSVQRVDLFDNNSKTIKYGAVFHLHSSTENAFNNFINNNTQNILSVVDLDNDNEIELEI